MGGIEREGGGIDVTDSLLKSSKEQNAEQNPLCAEACPNL